MDDVSSPLHPHTVVGGSEAGGLTRAVDLIPANNCSNPPYVYLMTNVYK